MNWWETKITSRTCGNEEPFDVRLLDPIYRELYLKVKMSGSDEETLKQEAYDEGWNDAVASMEDSLWMMRK